MHKCLTFPLHANVPTLHPTSRLSKYAFCRTLETHHKALPWLSNFPKTASITDVGPRDGLQAEPKAKIMPATVKVELIERLRQAGLKKIECGSFVSPKWVPQMANSEEVFEVLHADASHDTSYVGLVMNQRGMDRAVAKQVKEVLYVLSPSDEFCRRNMNCSAQEAYGRIASIADCCVDNGVVLRVVISTALGCPYEGRMEPRKVGELMARLAMDYSTKEVEGVVLADTIGVATAGSTYRLLDHLLCQHDFGFEIAVHFHDTYGQALANLLTSLSMGVRAIESSVGGLGGCPYAPGATGNVATEDVVYMLDGMGIETGIDLQALRAASNFIAGHLEKDIASNVARALNAKEK